MSTNLYNNQKHQLRNETAATNYIGEWSVSEPQQTKSVQTRAVEISELYY